MSPINLYFSNTLILEKKYCAKLFCNLEDNLHVEELEVLIKYISMNISISFKIII